MSEHSEVPQLTIWKIKHSRELIARLKKGESPPDIARIQFGDLTFDVSKGATVIPSEETYHHAKTIGSALHKIAEIPDMTYPIRVADVGTGSGLIAITLAKDLQAEVESGKIKLLATDISMKSLHDAQNNARSNNAEGITFAQGDGLDMIGNTDVIVSNPPFMKSSILKTSNAVVTSFIPPEAVVAGESGMDFYKKLFTGAQRVLSPRGIIIVQHQDFDRDNVARIVHDSLGASAAIKELRGRRQTALAIGNLTWANVLSSVQ
jgi:release factor glutamine methyltransferase